MASPASASAKTSRESSLRVTTSMLRVITVRLRVGLPFQR